MHTRTHRQAIRRQFDYWLAGWQNQIDTAMFSPNIALFSNQHDQTEGADAVAQAFAADRSRQIAVYALNHYLAGNDNQAALSAYVHGSLGAGEHRATFNGRAILRFTHSDGQWLITQIRLQLYPDQGRINGWPQDADERRWRSKQNTAVIISELDSPWALFPHNQLQGDDREQIHELYARYAWGIDLADWALLSDSFSADARTDLTPMGKRSGHREVYGQLRGFREATGELWHAATALDIRFTDDGQRADILLGRTISEQAFNTDGQALYGAHYKAQAVRGSDGVWRYAIFEYTPGWFVYNEAV